MVDAFENGGLAGPSDRYVVVRAREVFRLVPALLNANASIHATGAEQLRVRGVSASQVATAAAIERLEVMELLTVSPSREAVCLV